MIQPTKKNLASKKTMCICKGQIETTIHGECGKCGKYTGFCAVGHRKDKSCCPSPSCTGWETLRDEIITTCKAWSVKYMYQKMNDLLLSARTDEHKRIERLEIQLAGCGVAALGGTKNPAKKSDYGWSPSYQDVLDLRKKYDTARTDERKKEQDRWLNQSANAHDERIRKDERQKVIAECLEAVGEDENPPTKKEIEHIYIYKSRGTRSRFDLEQWEKEKRICRNEFRASLRLKGGI